jgi:hypothetical protein
VKRITASASFYEIWGKNKVSETAFLAFLENGVLNSMDPHPLPP